MQESQKAKPKILESVKSKNGSVEIKKSSLKLPFLGDGADTEDSMRFSHYTLVFTTNHDIITPVFEKII